MKTFRTMSVLAALIVAAGAIWGPSAQADAITDFYRGKTMVMVISSSAGGGYDTYARTLSRHIGRHIPGNPKFINKNMPGASGIRAANYIFHKAPQDGSLIAGTARGIAFEPRFRPKVTLYKPMKFLWLGSIAKDVSLMLANSTSGITSIDQLRTKTLVLGSVSSDQQDYAVLANNLLGLKLKIVAGYGGTSEVLLAMERGEVQGITAYSVSSLAKNRPDWLPSGKVTALLQFSLQKHPKLPNVPLANRGAVLAAAAEGLLQADAKLVRKRDRPDASAC